MAFLFLFFFLLSSQAAQFSTQQQQPPPPPPLSRGDLSVLFDIKRNLRDLPGSSFFSTWVFDSSAPVHPCASFAGVICSPADDDSPPHSPPPAFLRVTSLTLGTGLAGSPGLAGTLPASLANLSALTQLVVFAGRISGRIPTELGAAALPALRFVSITNNLLSGPIPASFTSAGGLSGLHTLDLGHNRLSGTVPPGLFSLPNLKVLILASNGGLYGGVPPINSRLLHLDLRQNAFSGPLPQPLPSTLRYLSAGRNAMSGPLDALAAGTFPDLAFLDLSMNAFTGPIPATLLSPRRPQEGMASAPVVLLLLQRNNLSGPIPAPPESTSVEGWTVDLSHNRLTGAVPAVLAAAESLFLNNNRLTGPLPSELSRSVYAGSMTTLYAQHNYLTAFDFPLPGDGGSTTQPLPEGVSVCLSYNCMAPPPVEPTGCPASAGSEQSRPPRQCPAFNNGTATIANGGGGDLSWVDEEP